MGQQLLPRLQPLRVQPLNLNPLRKILQRHVDVEALHESPVPLFITATSVHSGQARVFTGKELSIDALLASACLPFIFQAVEIDGEPYWDGGYTGNPAIFPLIYQTDSLDVLLVKINPLRREGTPTRSVEIIDRLSEITFNASLVGEMRAIAFVSRLVREGKLDPGHYKDLRLHMIGDDDGLAPYNASSKFNTDAAFLGRAVPARPPGHRSLARTPPRRHRRALDAERREDVPGQAGPPARGLISSASAGASARSTSGCRARARA